MAAEWITAATLSGVARVALAIAVYEVRRRRHEHGFHAEMLDALDDRVYRYRVDDLVVTYCNEAWARFVGTTPKAAIGRRLDSFVDEASLAAARAHVHDRSEAQTVTHRETVLQRADGRIVHEQWWDRVLLGRHGQRELLCVGRDVTERALMEERLARSERQHRELIQRLPLAAFVRLDRRIVFANQAAADLAGLDDPSQLLNISLDTLITSEGIEVMEQRRARRAAGLPVDPMMRVHGRTVGGDLRTVDIYSAPIELEGTECTLAVVNDVTDLVRTTSALSSSEERFRALADRASDVIFQLVVGAEPQVEYVNDAFASLTGVPVEELIERPAETMRALLGERDAARFLDVLTSAQGPRTFQLPITHVDGTRRWVDVRRSLTMGRDGSLVVEGTLRDVTPEKSLEKTLRDLANVDELTGLPNRRSLEDELERRLRLGGELSLLFLDLDRFKDVNDRLGHLAGDELLREIGRRLRRSCRTDDFVARLAGDEFIVITGALPDSVADRIRAELAMPVEIGDSTLSAQASIGVTRATPHDSAVTLLGRADAAMYDVKRTRYRPQQRS